MKRTTRLEKILQSWEPSEILNWQALQENVALVTTAEGRHYVLKEIGPMTNDVINRLHFEYDVLTHVEQKQVRVAVPKLAATGLPYVVDNDLVYRLSDWLPNRPAEARTTDEWVCLLRNYGTAIGQFHLALATCPDELILNRTWTIDLQKRILEEAVPVALRHLADEQRRVLESTLHELRAEMIQALAHLPAQLIIWDCHPGNVAVDGFDVTGFVDCDHLSLAPRISDLAYFLVHLIKFNIGNAKKEGDWLANFQQVIVGYESVIQLTQQERAALTYAMLGVPLIFMEFFFWSGMPERTKTEYDTFIWLVDRRITIAANLQ
jgi:Ser/Thr protein kinase RdoA (MazF antagonist)